MEQLPEEMWKVVFNLLPFETLKTTFWTCHRGRDLTTATLEERDGYIIESIVPHPLHQQWILPSDPKSRRKITLEFRMGQGRLSGADLLHLLQLVRTLGHHLSIRVVNCYPSSAHLSVEAIQALRAVPHVESVAFVGLEINHAQFQALSQNPQLIEWRSFGCSNAPRPSFHWTTPLVHFLRKLPNLTRIDWESNDQLTNELVNSMCHCHKLEHLNLRYCDAASDSLLIRGGSPAGATLKTIDVSNIKLKHLELRVPPNGAPSFPKLQELNIVGNPNLSVDTVTSLEVSFPGKVNHL